MALSGLFFPILNANANILIEDFTPGEQAERNRGTYTALFGLCMVTAQIVVGATSGLLVKVLFLSFISRPHACLCCCAQISGGNITFVLCLAGFVALLANATACVADIFVIKPWNFDAQVCGAF